MAKFSQVVDKDSKLKAKKRLKIKSNFFKSLQVIQFLMICWLVWNSYRVG